MYQMKRVSETLKEMKHQFEEEKRIICIARNDINAITSLLDKMQQLPIMSGPQIKDGQLEKLIKEIQNYNIVAEDLTIEINIHDQQLEEKRRRDIEKEITIEMYNKIHTEIESLATKREMVKNLLGNKGEEMTFLTNGIQLSTLDIDFIEDRLEARTKLFDDYMKSNKVTDNTLQQISMELGNHIQDIKTLTNEFMSYEVNIPNGEHIHDILKKIKEKEDILDHASDLLKKYDKENSNLQQLFDAIRLNNMAHIFELLIKNFHKTFRDLTSYKEEIVNIRLEIHQIEDKIKNKERQLEEMLVQIIAQMKTKPLAYPTNGNNKDLLDYFTSMYNLKKENQVLKNLTKKIKDKGTQVVELCRNIISFQEKENHKLTLEISVKTDVIKNLQERFCNLHNEVRENTRLVLLQTKLEHLLSENEHLLLMNAFLKTNNTKINDENQNWKDRLDFLEAQNTELIGSNLELRHSNVELKTKLQKMENYVAVVRRNLRQLQLTDEPDDSDDSFSF